jgi:DNA-binding NarL/FixJ family response regulator
MTIRTVAVEDDRRYRTSLETLFAHADGFELADSFSSADEAIERATAIARDNGPLPWDIVLMDLELPGIGGTEATRILKQIAPATRVIVVTVFDSSNTVLEAICAGADGYLTKRTSPATIVEEVRSVVAGGAPLSAGVARTVLNLLRSSAIHRDDATPGAVTTSLDLTERELAVLRCLVRGRPYKHVASDLDISIDTVRSHIRHIYGKLQVHSVAQAVSRAIREGLV